MGSHPLFIPHATYIVAALVKKHTSHLLIATHSFTVAPMRLPPVRILEPASPHHGIDMCQTLPTKNQSFVKVFPTNKNTDFPHKKYRRSRQTNAASCVTVNMSLSPGAPCMWAKSHMGKTHTQFFNREDFKKCIEVS
jgi:hypothetical protein